MLNDLGKLLQSVQVRKSASGIMVASRYVETIRSCAGDDVCSAQFKTADTNWETYIKAAATRLVYREPEMEVKEFTSVDVPAGFCAQLDCYLTVTKKDRDGDLLESSGADLDMDMPFLWQHVPLQPMGRIFRMLEQNSKYVLTRFGIVDSELGQDAALLFETKCLRISHGFKPLEFEPMKATKGEQSPPGWHIRKFSVLEGSGVSVPSNDGAVVTAFSREKLHHPVIKAWAQKKFEERPVVVPSGFEAPKVQIEVVVKDVRTEEKSCGCGIKSASSKPSNCSCKYPDVKFRNGSGHAFECPVHKEWAANHTPKGDSNVIAKTFIAGQTKDYDAKGNGSLFIGLPYFAGSWEETIDDLEDGAEQYLKDHGVAIDKNDCVCVIATFPDSAVLCVRKGYSYDGYRPSSFGDNDFDTDDGYAYYRLAWSMVNDEPTFSGEPVAVELNATAIAASKRIMNMETKSGRAVSRKNAEMLTEAHDLVSEVNDHPKTSKDHKGLCDKAMKCLKSVIGGEKGDEPDAVAPQKAARVLSKEKLALVKEAHDYADTMHKSDDMHRPGKSMLKEAKGYMKSVMAAAGADNDSGTNTPTNESSGSDLGVTNKPNPGADPKSVAELSKASTDLIATRCLSDLLLGKEFNPDLLKRLHEAASVEIEKLQEAELASLCG